MADIKGDEAFCEALELQFLNFIETRRNFYENECKFYNLTFRCRFFLISF